MEPAATSGSRRTWTGTHAPAALILGLLWTTLAPPATAGPPPTAPADPFTRFDLPDSWEALFWANPATRALFALDPKAVAALVPEQAGVRFCRCPACEAGEADDPLVWSVERPKVLTCKRCGVVVPDKHFPARDDKKHVPEDTIEVMPGVVHHYPYHEVDAEHQRYPEERLYLSAKRDHEAREFLTRAALYAAIRHHEQPIGHKDPDLARVASVLLLRFAQVYPKYATHYDQPASPKLFQQANLPPPYRRGYGTGKWDWTGSQDVPLNLVIAYALVRGSPALAEAGRLLKEPDPARTIERDLFRASAEFVRRQPEEFGESSLQADRGILAVGRLLNDPELVNDALERLNRFAERGFYHDGFWRQGTLTAHRRVLGQLDGWIDRLLVGSPGLPVGRTPESSRGGGALPMLALARAAGSAVLTDPRTTYVALAAWPVPASRSASRSPTFLGGVGLARLAVGQGDDALDVELRGFDSAGPSQIQRQAIRLAVGGRTVLGDLDESDVTATGFEHASVSRNTVVVDGLNQRESMAGAGEPAAGGNFVFFAADRDFQAVALDDQRSYPSAATRYRQTVVASSDTRSRYAVAVFEVHGGLQHDQLFHGPSGSPARWRLSVPTAPGPTTLLPPGLTYLPTARPEDGRWFVQAFGEFTPLRQGTLTHPGLASLDGVRLHLLGDVPTQAVTATSPDPAVPGRRGPGDESGRGSLVLRRRGVEGAALRSTFVTVFEPITGSVPALKRVGRVGPLDRAAVVYLETAEGPEHVVVNLTPGKPTTARLADGRDLTTDGLAVRVTGAGLVLAGGTFAQTAGLKVDQAATTGRITRSIRLVGDGTRGWFETGTRLPDVESLAGRVLLIRHGDGSTRGWSLLRVENRPTGARLFVREEPGFRLDPNDGSARYYQFPRTVNPGPHSFHISRISRAGTLHAL